MRTHHTHTAFDGVARTMTVGVTNGTGAIALTVSREGAKPGRNEDRISAPLDDLAAVRIAADLILHAANLRAGAHANSGGRDLADGTDASAEVLRMLQQVTANLAANLPQPA